MPQCFIGCRKVFIAGVVIALLCAICESSATQAASANRVQVSWKSIVTDPSKQVLFADVNMQMQPDWADLSITINNNFPAWYEVSIGTSGTQITNSGLPEWRMLSPTGKIDLGTVRFGPSDTLTLFARAYTEKTGVALGLDLLSRVFSGITFAELVNARNGDLDESIGPCLVELYDVQKPLYTLCRSIIEIGVIIKSNDGNLQKANLITQELLKIVRNKQVQVVLAKIFGITVSDPVGWTLLVGPALVALGEHLFSPAADKVIFIARLIKLIQPPSSLEILSISDNVIRLGWADNSNNEGGFNIYRDGSIIAQTSENQVSYIDTNLTAGTQYCYRVTAFGTAGESESSNGVCATTFSASASISISINNGNPLTHSLITTLNITAASGGTENGIGTLSQMRFSNNGSRWSPWEPYAATKTTWDLSRYGGNSAPGIKTVYAQFKPIRGSVLSASTSIEYCPFILDVNPISLSFSAHENAANPSTQSFMVQNSAGCGAMYWTLTKNASWLSVDATSGTAPSMVHVSVNTTGLAANTYTDTITVVAPDASGDPKTISVTLIVINDPPTITSLSANPTSVSQGGTSTVSVAASDAENDPITYTWSATGGTLSSTSGPDPKTWTAPSTPGPYTVTVSVTDNKSGHSPISKSVDLTVTTDTTPLALITDFQASDDEDSQITLTWTNPQDADLAEVVVRRGIGALANHTSGNDVPQCHRLHPIRGALESCIDSGPDIVNGETMTYAVFSRDQAGNWNDQVVFGKNLDFGTPQLHCAVTLDPTQSIQAAINSVAEGEKICLKEGTWQENLVIPKSLTILAKPPHVNFPTIKGIQSNTPVISIESDSQVQVVLEDLTVGFAPAASICLLGMSCANGIGVKINGIAHVQIINSLITQNGNTGVLISGSSQLSLRSNTISQNSDAGLWVSGFAQVSVSNSEINNNQNEGIRICSESADCAAQVTITNSSIKNNAGDGLTLYGSATQATLQGDFIGLNSLNGIKVRDSTVQLLTTTIAGNGILSSCPQIDQDTSICNGILVEGTAHVTLTGSLIAANNDWGVSALLMKCGYSQDDFAGQVIYQDNNNTITGNNTAGKQTGEICLPNVNMSFHSASTKPQDQRVTEIQVFTLAGRSIFRMGRVPNSFIWHGLDTHDKPVANGVYLAVITMRRADGTIIKREVKKIIIKR